MEHVYVDLNEEEIKAVLAYYPNSPVYHDYALYRREYDENKAKFETVRELIFNDSKYFGAYCYRPDDTAFWREFDMPKIAREHGVELTKFYDNNDVIFLKSADGVPEECNPVVGSGSAFVPNRRFYKKLNAAGEVIKLENKDFFK